MGKNTTKPKGVKAPQDHKSPAQRDAEGAEVVEIEHNGVTYTIPADADDWTVETTLAFEEGKAMSGIRGVLGPKQWATYLKSKPVNADARDLFDKIAEAVGMETAGE